MQRHSLYQPYSVNQLSLWNSSRQHLSWRHLPISGIFQLLLIRFWPNFKSWILGPCLKEANCHGDICTGIIASYDICPYHQYLSCCWSDFDQTYWIKFLWTKMFLDTTSLDPNFSRPKICLDPKLFRAQNLWSSNLIGLKNFANQNIFHTQNILFILKRNVKFFFRPKTFANPKFFQNSFRTQSFFWPKSF